MEAKPLHGRHVWLTGASRGVGRALAVRLARAGATLSLGARSMGDLEQLAALLRGEGGAVQAYALDLCDTGSIAAFAEASVAASGPVEILVNNAGVGRFRDMDAMEPAAFEEQIAVNLRGPWHLTRAAVPHMKRLGRGHVVCVSSIAGTVAFRRGTAYCAAKAGVEAMTAALMHEVREFGIRTTVVAPGSVDTRFHRDALPAGHHKDQAWMLEAGDVADGVMHVLMAPAGAMVTRYEIRPRETGK